MWRMQVGDEGFMQKRYFNLVFLGCLNSSRFSCITMSGWSSGVVGKRVGDRQQRVKVRALHLVSI